MFFPHRLSETPLLHPLCPLQPINLSLSLKNAAHFYANLSMELPLAGFLVFVVVVDVESILCEQRSLSSAAVLGKMRKSGHCRSCSAKKTYFLQISLSSPVNYDGSCRERSKLSIGNQPFIGRASIKYLVFFNLKFKI